MEHSWLEPMSIFRFLGSLTTFSELESGTALLQMWALDYANASRRCGQGAAGGDEGDCRELILL